MKDFPAIQFLKNKEIDKDRWDDCITLSVNNLIYAKTFYLDNIASGWAAITGPNYEWVFPLTIRQKFGISYLYQPAFTQQLGVFSKAGVIVPYQEIISWLQKHYLFCEINLNFATCYKLASLPVTINLANNFILDLSPGYEAIAANYHSDLNKNLKRSKNFRNIYRQTNDFNICINLYNESYGNRIPHVKESDYKNFSKVCDYASQNSILICREVINENGTLLASALLLFDGSRLYNLMNTTTPAGRKTKANHFLLNSIIKEFSGKDIIFDFEGSDLPGVKNFYENFGAINQPYLKMKYNCLPWPINLLKK